MASRTDWDKINRQRRLDYVPSPRVQPATQKQLDYIISLAYRKGQPRPRLPKTKHGASEHIDRLLALPDIEGRPPQSQVSQPVEPVKDDRQALVIELREQFPQLTPMTVNSMVQLFGQIDPLGMTFLFDGLMQEETPEDPDALILFMLRRFLEEFAPVSDDDATLVPG